MPEIFTIIAPIVKWLSQPSYERLFWVQFPVGAILYLKIQILNSIESILIKSI